MRDMFDIVRKGGMRKRERYQARGALERGGLFTRLFQSQWFVCDVRTEVSFYYL